MTQPSQQIRIIAQPKALYRERYGSEQCETGNRFQRYIRAEDNQLNLEYPTIESLGGQSQIVFGLKTGIRTIQKTPERAKLDLRQNVTKGCSDARKFLKRIR
ncbi:unnamed protein product [Adineta steineri]|uniref:Uncharacterized protein n=1 Tax=Adineta steineri TaxID=433720 RepID=A0A815LV50_9BILA|nr:unnamed protein product [Adineta steineri]CAF1618785.1 unnamed protein product [Adineta steineri]